MTPIESWVGCCAWGPSCISCVLCAWVLFVASHAWRAGWRCTRSVQHATLGFLCPACLCAVCTAHVLQYMQHHVHFGIPPRPSILFPQPAACSDIPHPSGWPTRPFNYAAHRHPHPSRPPHLSCRPRQQRHRHVDRLLCAAHPAHQCALHQARHDKSACWCLQAGNCAPQRRQARGCRAGPGRDGCVPLCMLPAP